MLDTFKIENKKGEIISVEEAKSNLDDVQRIF